MEAATVRPVESALSAVVSDALIKSATPEGEAAYGHWHERVAEAGATLERETFASEAAFGAVARLTLEEKLGARAAGFQAAFPHLYGSASFSWYEMDPGLRAAVLEELAEHEDQEPAELLGWLYQFVIPQAVRKQFGQFYTGRQIVRSMLDGAGYFGPDILGRKLIDPASGAGAFLIEATRRLLASAKAEGLTPEETCAAVQHAIHGLDLNALGVLLTEAAIALLLAPLLAETAEDFELEPLRLFVTDSLRRGELGDLTAEGPVLCEIKNRAERYGDGFEYVIANPPYAKFPTRLMTEEQRRRFAATTYGHPNLYGLFLQIGVELLADGGRLAYINPKSFVSGQYFRNLRRFLVEKLDIERFDMFASRTGLFDGVLQEVVILHAERSASQREEIELREYDSAPDGPAAVTTRVSAGSVLLPDAFDCAFFVTADPLAHRVLERMTDGSTPLSEHGWEAVTGTIVWNRVKPLIHDEPGDARLPLIWGKGIRTFKFTGFGNRNGESAFCDLTDKTRGIVSRGDALLVKRLTAREEKRRIVACRMPAKHASSPAGYFGENHINIVRPANDASLDIDALLGLLNSRLFDYIFRALNGNTQVSATELQMLPIPDSPVLEEIAEQARKLTAANGHDPKALKELNQQVYRLYGITKADADALGYES
jgi:adenine-specific DNA-methyltransferase